MKIVKTQKEGNGEQANSQTIYYNMREVGIMVGKSYQTILDYKKYSDEAEEMGDERLIPEPILIKEKDGIRGVAHYTAEQTEEIKAFVRTLKKGDLLRFTRKNNAYMKMKERNLELEAENTMLRKSIKYASKGENNETN